jgi:hypothetical protein
VSALRGPRLDALLLAAVAVVLAFTVASPRANASDDGSSWQFAPAQAPPPPTGAQSSPFPVALGQVGDIEFWSPNRGVLITAGNGLVSAGVYAYDGVSWHQLSNVCGGHAGRIAWAGPDEFWTISDQRPGQVTPTGAATSGLWDVSLCHFQNGQVVGSYAMPLEQPDSYLPMDAAACEGPEDCWFGGALGKAPNSGAFHLYWDGTVLSVLYSPQDHAVASMAVDQGQIYESVQLAPGDAYTSGESQTNPPLLQTIVATDPEDAFHSLFPTDTQDPTCGAFCPPLPEYGLAAGGQPVAPDTLSGLALSSDWSPSGDGPSAPQLWAVAGADSTRPPAGEGEAHPIALRYSLGSSEGQLTGIWTQIVPDLASFETGEEPMGIAADPGEEAAWVTIGSEDGFAHVDLLSSADGGQAWAISEREELGPDQGIGSRGGAGPISCPAAHECWLATSEGWLFHLTDGVQLTQDSDPFFDGADGVISYRPRDNGVPEELPDQPPEDDSLANQQPPAPTPSPPTLDAEPSAKTTTAAALAVKVRSRVVREQTRVHGKLVDEDVLELTFTLVAKAHVQLLASRSGHVVAKTARQTLRKGRHTLKLTLNPRRWPTKLNLHATAAG